MQLGHFHPDLLVITTPLLVQSYVASEHLVALSRMFSFAILSAVAAAAGEVLPGVALYEFSMNVAGVSVIFARIVVTSLPSCGVCSSS